MSIGVKQSSVFGCIQKQYFHEKHSQISRWPTKQNKTKQKHLGSLVPQPLAYLGWSVLFGDPSQRKLPNVFIQTKLSRISLSRLKQWTKIMKCSRDKCKDWFLEVKKKKINWINITKRILSWQAVEVKAIKGICWPNVLSALKVWRSSLKKLTQ